MGVSICSLTTFMARWQPDKPQGDSFEQVFGTAGPIAAARCAVSKGKRSLHSCKQDGGTDPPESPCRRRSKLLL